MTTAKFAAFALAGASMLVMGLSTSLAAAAPGYPQVASNHLTKEEVVDRVFTNVERRILKRYFEARYGSRKDDDNGRSPGKGKNKGGGLPPGLAKRGGELPPGLAKRGGDLPPGLAKRLPRDLQAQLPPRGPRFRRVIVDNDIVLIDAATNKILDILEDVILGRN